MANKRRDGKRVRHKPHGKGAEIPPRTAFHRWKNEAVSIFWLGCALFVFLSLVSITSLGNVEQLVGPLGHVVGTLFQGFFGYGAFAAVVYGMYLSLWWWRRDNPEEHPTARSRIFASLGICGVLVSLCGLLHLGFGRALGGTVGALFANPVSGIIGGLGAAITGLVVLVSSLTLATGLTVPELGISTASGVGRASSTLFLSLPRAIGLGILRLFQIGAGLLLTVFRLALPRREPAIERHIPQPRSRRNSIPELDKEQESEPPEDAQPLRSAKEIIVKRRTGDEDKGKRVITKRKRGFPDYKLPDTTLLTHGEVSLSAEGDDELRGKSLLIERKLADFGIQGKITEVRPGPVITLFEFEPAPGVKVGRIASLQDDLAMSLRASSVRIIAPIPRRGTVGIEVPNKQRDMVRLRDVLESRSFLDAESSLTVSLGKDTDGEPVVVDVAAMPHLLVAGATGTGKSVCINSILVSLLYRTTPAELGLIMIDPKVLELSVYDGIPHLRVPVVTVPRQARAVLEWAVSEMERRYRLMQRFGVRSIDGYNRVARGDDGERPATKSCIELREETMVEPGVSLPDSGAASVDGTIPAETIEPLPKLLIVIDELADLMLSSGREIEELITRLAQKARASGIHLLVATQRPSVDVITGLIKANFPARLSFQVTTRVDSRTILDSMGAERLLGKGDMLFMQPGTVGLRRLHGCFVSDGEVKKVVDAVKQNGEPQYDERIMALCARALEEEQKTSSGPGGAVDGEYDEFYDQALQLVVEKGYASTSMIQRVFRIGYNRAARIVEMLERDGVVGPMDGSKPRPVLLPSAAEGGDG